MPGPAPLSFNFVLFVAIAALAGLAVSLVVGLLIGAVLLPRGHPAADRLRQIAGEMPRFALAALVWIPTVAFVGVIAFFALV
jgi:hypothetical protein